MGDRFADERSFGGRPDRERADQRQGGLAFGKIVAEILADGVELARVIEHIVDELERGTEMHAVPCQGVFDDGLREAMADGSDAVSDWPLLNALLNTAGGATWVSIHHGGGVGMGYAQHAGVVIVCDGTPAAAKRIERVLWNDPPSGVMRHADAGYAKAIEVARAKGLKLPMLGR